MAVFPFTVRATDSEGSYADRQFNITVRNSRVERFMVLGNTDAYTSPDGTTWSQRSGQGGHTCAYGNGFWLILQFGTYGNNNTTWGFQAKKSTDGINYNLITNSSMIFQKSDGTVISSAAFPYLFTNAASASAGYPLTNSTYTTANSTVQSVPRVRFWNGKFWLVTTGNHLTAVAANRQLMLWSSPDGITWTENVMATAANANTGLTTTLSSGTYNFSDSDGAFFIPNPVTASAVAGSTPLGWMTTDGVTFTPIENSAIAASNPQFCGALTRINGLYLMQYGSTGTGSAAYGANQYQYSTDGVNWTTATLSGASGAQPIFYMNGVLYSHQGAGGANSGFVLTSTDALTWTSITYQTFSTGNATCPQSIAKNGIQLVSGVPSAGAAAPAGQGTTIAASGVRISTDGSTFTSVALPNAPAYVFDVAAM